MRMIVSLNFKGKHEFKLRPVSKADALRIIQRQRLQNRDDYKSRGTERLHL
jgi:hypothetical protein